MSIYGGLILIILGALVYYGKCYFLVAGYNTLPKRKKEKFKEEGHLSNYMKSFRNMMWGAGFSILTLHLASYYLNINFPNHTKPIVFAVWIIPYIIYMNWKYRKILRD